MIDIDSKVKGLIFDLDGTIADTMPIHYIAWRNAAAKYGIDFSVELFNEYAGTPLYPMVRKLNELFGTEVDPKEMGGAKEAEFEQNMYRAKPIGPVVEVIKTYYGKLPMSVGTGGLARIARKTLELIGVSRYIDIIVSADDVTHYKPHPETFLRCAELMGVKPEDCLVFEDSAFGIQAAGAAGMQAVDVTAYYQVTTGQEM